MTPILLPFVASYRITERKYLAAAHLWVIEFCRMQNNINLFEKTLFFTLSVDDFGG